MPRLYLIILLLINTPYLFSQNKIKKHLEFAKEQYQKGDYYHALIHYKEAMKLDSNTIDILWNVAETYRAYKDYRTAEYYYRKVYDREEARIYPASLLYLGLMQKQNGKYEEAIQTFKKAKKKYYKKKKSYLYRKAKQELISTIWAKSSAKDTLELNITQLPENVNTVNAEFGHIIYEKQLIFSSLRADSISEQEEVYSPHYKTSLYKSKIVDSAFSESQQIKDLLIRNYHTGNGTFSLDGKRFYFSKCNEKEQGYRCKIMVARYQNGKWTDIDSLGEIINSPNSNTTMPCIAKIQGKEALIFSSDREETEGGMDLFYSYIKNGNQFSKVRPLKTINSIDNELSPWWDFENNRLYFSSSWNNNFGGYDIFYSQYRQGQFEKPQNIGIPYNSPANDLYYFQYGDSTFVSSNRLGVLYSKNPTCCSDIFLLTPKTTPKKQEETLADLNKRLPVTLYFHNDEPNPRTWDTVSTIDYMESYDAYIKLLPVYKKEYSKGLTGEKANEARIDIEDFFIEYVNKGVEDLKLFQRLLKKELEKGAKIRITVQGFASPLAKTDYNVNLTKRRISSIKKYFRKADNGFFIPYLDSTAKNGGYLVFTQIPFGEYSANQMTSDNPNDVKNSVYSRAAAIERKIELQSVSYIQEDEFPLDCSLPVHNFGITSKGEILSHRFTIKNNGKTTIHISDINKECDCIEVNIQDKNLSPQESTTIDVQLNTKQLKGFIIRKISVKAQGKDDEQLNLFITTEVK